MTAGTLSGTLITGSSGQVGGELVRACTGLGAHLGPVYAPPRAELDLMQPDSIRRVVRALRPRWIVNAGAYTAVDRAESESETAYAINASAVSILGEEAAALGSAVLHFSTDYVFDGKGEEPYQESDPAGPINVYGASKLAGEQALAASGAAHLILRTSWVYGASGKNFLRTVLQHARENPRMNIVDDQHGSPTWSRELARVAAVIMQHCESEATDLEQAVRAVEGVYHAACAGETTWFGFALEALHLARVMEPETRFAELFPIASADFQAAAARPLNSRLDTNKIIEVFGCRIMDWKVALEEVMLEIRSGDRRAVSAPEGRQHLATRRVVAPR